MFLVTNENMGLCLYMHKFELTTWSKVGRIVWKANIYQFAWRYFVQKGKDQELDRERIRIAGLTPRTTAEVMMKDHRMSRDREEAPEMNELINNLLNRFHDLNNKIDKDWLNVSLETYKTRCKLLFLENGINDWRIK